MSVSEKIRKQAHGELQEDVLGAAMVVPPGATLYRAFAPGGQTTFTGPIVQALKSKADGAVSTGSAAEMPTQQGVLALTPTRLYFLKKKLLGVGAGKRLADWPRDSVVLEYALTENWKYPALLLTFEDGSTCVVFGEKKWGLETLVAEEPR